MARLFSGLTCVCFAVGVANAAPPATAPGPKWEAIDNGAACGGVFADGDRSMREIEACMRRDASRGVKFGYNALATGIGTLDLRAGMAEFTTTDAFTVERMTSNTSLQPTQRNTALNIGMTDVLLSGRLAISTDLAWSQDETAWRTGQENAFGPDAQTRNGSGHWHKADVTIIDTPTLKWSAVGEYSRVDDDYVANRDGRPTAVGLMPGERRSLTTALKAFGASLRGTQEVVDSPYGERETRRLKLDVDGVTGSFTGRRVALHPLDDPSRISATLETGGVALEVTPGAAMPEWSAALDEFLPVVPELVTVSFATGQAWMAVDSTMRPQSSIEALASWSGSLGETTALYCSESRGEAGAARERDQFLDVSHDVRWGHWRASAGVTLADYSSAAGEGFNDAMVSGNLLLTYEVAGGTQFKIRVGHDLDQFRMGDDSFASIENTSDLSISLDLSAHARRLLGRPAQFALEYRRKHEGATEFTPWAEWSRWETVTQDERDGLLVSFATRL